MAEPGEGSPEAGERRASKVGEHWAAYAKDNLENLPESRVQWNQWNPVQEMINRRIAGAASRNVVGRLADTLGTRVHRVLSLGCGSGAVDRDMLEQGVCDEVVGVDVSQGALEMAVRLAGDLPLKYIRLDLESEPLPRGFPLAFCVATLHHINNLGGFLANLYESIDEGGIFALFEYVGPSRFQWTPGQLRLAGDIYGFLPPRYRFNHLPRRTEYELRRPALSGMISVDPSEAVRSAEMTAVVERYFERIDRWEAGGGVLFPLLTGIVANFDEDDGPDRAFIDLAMRLDEALTDAGALPSCFNFEVYRRRSEPLGGQGAKKLEAARASLVSGQEARIVELNRELEEAEDVNRPLVEEFDRLVNENKAKSFAVRERLEENTALKSTAPFRAARVLKRLAVGGARADEGVRPVEPPQAEVNPFLPAPVLVEDRPRSVLARAVETYARDASSGRVSLWALWLAAASGPSGSALLLGLEPGMATACEASGACERATQARLEPGGEIVVEWPAVGGGDGPYDMVVWAAGAEDPAGAARSIDGALADGGRLVRLSLPPEGGSTRDAPGFVRIEEAWFPLRPRIAPDPQPPPGADREMALPVAALGLYVECVLAGRGLGGPRLHVEVFERGELRAGVGGERTAVDDIAVLQEMELGRLERRLAESYEAREHLVKLCEDASAAVAANEAVLEYLERERSILRSRGPWKYPWWAAFRLRERKGGR
ncbi:MAG: class I SAM-dependent methyltransferase [Actinomycetota bacterium]